jgi:hypothetical protein
LQFDERSQFFIRTHNETLPAAMRVSDRNGNDIKNLLAKKSEIPRSSPLFHSDACFRQRAMIKA